jgi:chemotaxis protein methyltransferase CheR
MVRISQKEFYELTRYIKDNFGIHLKEEKKTLVLGRLQNELKKKGFNNFTDYLDYVRTDKTGGASVILIDKISTNHTFFMREPEHFNFFKNTVLPYLKKTVTDHDLRVWCAASSSGEEAYTLAMLIDEIYGLEKNQWDTKILATDISENILEIAKKGIYSKDQIEVLPVKWKTNYFREYGKDQVVIKDLIKQEVIFRRFNLIDKHFPFKRRFHTIFCRNVMIYFDNPTKIELVNKFYEQLEYGGYLFIGHSESLNKEMTKLKYIMPSVYQKI